MSKAIKDLLVDDLKHRLREVGDVIVVSLGILAVRYRRSDT